MQHTSTLLFFSSSHLFSFHKDFPHLTYQILCQDVQVYTQRFFASPAHSRIAGDWGPFVYFFSPCQTDFRPGRSTLDPILYLSQSISNGFNKPRPGCQTILYTIAFFKAFDSVWHLALFHNLISAGLFALLVFSFPIDALVWFIKITKVLPFESIEVFCKDPFLAPFFSFSMIYLLPSAAFFVLTTFLEVTFDCNLSFPKHISLLKTKFFPRLKASCCISGSSWCPCKESLSVLYKSFLWALLTYASPGWFPF